MSSEGCILILNEVLFFGNKLDHSLINPNQIRHHGIPVFDNPYNQDSDREMGMVVSDTCCIPFASEGSTIYFTSSYPTNEEMELYPHIVITSNESWDPQSLVIPGRLVSNRYQPDRFIEKVQSHQLIGTNRHQHMYESDCIALSTFGDMEQLLMERIVQSVNVDLGGSRPTITHGPWCHRHGTPQLPSSLIIYP